MRALHKSWQNQRPGWTRRVRWYQGHENQTIRLNFQDEFGEVNGFYVTKEEAQEKYDQFAAGGINTTDLRWD